MKLYPRAYFPVNSVKNLTAPGVTTMMEEVYVYFGSRGGDQVGLNQPRGALVTLAPIREASEWQPRNQGKWL